MEIMDKMNPAYEEKNRSIDEFSKNGRVFEVVRTE